MWTTAARQPVDDNLVAVRGNASQALALDVPLRPGPGSTSSGRLTVRATSSWMLTPRVSSTPTGPIPVSWRGRATLPPGNVRFHLEDFVITGGSFAGCGFPSAGSSGRGCREIRGGFPHRRRGRQANGEEIPAHGWILSTAVRICPRIFSSAPTTGSSTRGPERFLRQGGGRHLHPGRRPPEPLRREGGSLSASEFRPFTSIGRDSNGWTDQKAVYLGI